MRMYCIIHVLLAYYANIGKQLDSVKGTESLILSTFDATGTGRYPANPEQAHRRH